MPGNFNSGKRPLPTNIKRLNGTLRADRTLENEIEPELITEIPPCPDYFNEYSREEWETACYMLIDQGILATVDVSLLQAYCTEWGTYVQLIREAHKEGIKWSHRRDLLRASNLHLKTAMSLGAQFGMSPSSRTKIPSNKVPKPSALDLI